jgi:hypothetical protein
MLTGADDEGLEVVAGLEGAEDGGELDHLRTGAEDAENPRPRSCGLAQRSAGLGIKRLRGVA